MSETGKSHILVHFSDICSRTVDICNLISVTRNLVHWKGRNSFNLTGQNVKSDKSKIRFRAVKMQLQILDMKRWIDTMTLQVLQWNDRTSKDYRLGGKMLEGDWKNRKQYMLFVLIFKFTLDKITKILQKKTNYSSMCGTPKTVSCDERKLRVRSGRRVWREVTVGWVERKS